MKRLAALCLLIFACSQAWATEPNLYPGEKLVPVTLPESGHLVESGWTRAGRSVAYRLKVAAGTRLKFYFKASAAFTYLVIFDLNDPDPMDAIYSSDERKLPAHIAAEKDMDLLIRPYYAKQAARRGLGAHYVLEIRKDNAG